MRTEDQRYLEELYLTHHSALLRKAQRYLDNQEDASLAVQEVFRSARREIDALHAAQDPSLWLSQALEHVCRILRRARGRRLHLQLSIGEQLPPDAPPSTLLDAYAGILKPADLTLLRQIYIEGHSYDEAARTLGIGVWACRKRAQRAITKIREAAAN